ncbi:MAG: IS3 family transposase [Anaerocolumna sp.]
MCKLLGISRSYYYKLLKLQNAVNKITQREEQVSTRIIDIWESSKMMYGSRKISAILKKEGINLSRYQVLRLMKKLGISSLYNKNTKFKPYKCKSHITQNGENLLNQEFYIWTEREVLTSDLTYVKCADKFGYVCFVLDLFNREIVACNVSLSHDATFVLETLNQINISKTHIFHSARGTEFVNQQIDKLLEDNGVTRSLSKTGCPFDNAVSENLFGLFKREWAKERYSTLEELKNDVDDFVHNYNNFRVHSKLSYMSPVEYRLSV